MAEIHTITWIIIGFGALTFLPLLIAQSMMIIKPESRKTKDMIIGKDEEWRDRTHYKSALAFAWADWLVFFPLFVIGTYGVLNEYLWGYLIWFGLGLISIYFSILFWVMEKEYVYPSHGWIAYYTYFWGFFLYWGLISVIYSILVLYF